MRRLRSTGKIRRPTADELADLAELSYIHLTPQEALDLEELSKGLLSTLDRLDDLPQPRWPIKYTDRDPGYRPTEEEDPYNIFIRKCRVTGAPSGKLAGKKIGLKDNIAVAGIPLTNGSRLATDHRRFVGDAPQFDDMTLLALNWRQQNLEKTPSTTSEVVHAH